MGGTNGGCGVLVFNNYRQLIRCPFLLNVFLILNHAKSGYTVTRHTFSCSHLTISVIRCFFFKITDTNWWMTNVPGDCTDHRAPYARELVDQSASLEIWGLHRPPSTVCSGTGRPVYQFGDLGTTPTTEYRMLGDWSTSLPVWRSRDCTDHRAPYARGLVDQSASLEIWVCINYQALHARGLDNFNFFDLATRLILRLPASLGITSVRCIWRCI